MCLLAGCFQLKWIKGWLSCLDHQQPRCTVSPSSQHPLIVFPLRTDRLFGLCAPSYIPTGGQWMVGGSSGWDDWFCLSEDRTGSCLLCVGVFMRGGEWFCLRPVWSPSSFSLFAPCSLSKLFLLLNEVTAAYQYGWLCRFLQETLLPLLWRDWPGIYVVVWLIEYDFQFRLVVMMIPRNTFSDCVSLVFGFLPLVSIAAGLNVQGCSCGTNHVIRSHAIYLDVDGVTLWFCIVSMCSSLPLASPSIQ